MFQPFRYQTLETLEEKIKNDKLNLPISHHLDILKNRVQVDGYELSNGIAIQPMEGCDGNADGSPGELTIRRYKRFAEGGAGLLWFEAVAVVPEGRANPRHLWIHEKNVESFKNLMDTIKTTAQKKYGKDHTPICIMQLTHAGRFARPVDKPQPVIAYHNPYLNEKMTLPDDYPVIHDDELERLEDSYVQAALLAKEAGFHGVDIKACHRYLASELLSGYGRKGKYGNDFEGRTRLIRSIAGKIREKLGMGFIMASRLNLYDGIPYPYGFGVSREEGLKMDLSEPLKLIELLQKQGVSMINATMGTPYYNPHVNRPYDKGGYIPDEDPIRGVERLVLGAGAVQQKFPELTVVGTGYSWLRHLAPYVAAGVIEKGMAKIVGFGRQAIAYPDFAGDIFKNGGMKKEKSCITCGKCTELMRAKSVTGCVVRDKVYTSLYKEYCMK